MVSNRKCIVSGEQKSKEELIRFALSPDHQVIPDIKGNLPGRGIWITANYAKVKEAQENALFSKAFKTKLDIGESLSDKTEELLLNSALSWLSMANKSGSIVCGKTKVEKAIYKLKSSLLLEAADASEDGKKKVRALRNALERETGQNCDIVSIFTVKQMSLALGRENVVHAAITNRHMASKFMEVIKRLEKFRN